MHFFGCYSLYYKVVGRVFVLGDSQAIWPELHSECLSPPLSLASFMLTVFVGLLLVGRPYCQPWRKLYLGENV